MLKFKYQSSGQWGEAKNKALNEIYQDLMENLGEQEIKRYYDTFKRQEIDFNIAQYGNLLVYYYQVREFLISCGFSKYSIQVEKKGEKVYLLDDTKAWEYYKYLVGTCVNYIINHKDWIKGA